jgi:micrococcal nuclease
MTGRGSVDEMRAPPQSERKTMRLRGLLVLAVTVVALAVPAAASAKVRLVYVTTPINHGAHATLAVAVSSPQTCSITVLYKSGPSHARGLSPRRPINGKVAWSWMVGTSTEPTVWCVV